MTTNVQPGGSLLIAWQLKDRHVVIVGGGEVASQRLVAVLSADALVTLIAPTTGLHPLVVDLIAASPRITYRDHTFSGQHDLTGADMVLTAIDDVSASREICALCRTLKIPVNVADDPPSCDFYFGALVRQGPLQVMISTNGNGPKIASLIKRRIEDALPDNVGDAVEKVGLLRQRLRQRAPGVGGDLGKRRMKWMSGICDAWPLDELAQLDEDTIEQLLDKGWEHNVIPRPLHARPSWRQRLPDNIGPFSAGLVAGLLAATTSLLIARQRMYF